MILKMYQ